MAHGHGPLPFADDPSGSASGAAVAERILSSISLGLLAVGERLPSEVELAQQFGVAVNTLRKGLSKLRDREIVVTRRGRSGGTFIARAPFPSPDEVRERLLETSLVDLRDLRDEQVAVGSAIGRLAATRAWGSSIERLAGLAERVTRASTAAEALKLTAEDLKKLALIDGVITEPLGGAHRSPAQAMLAVGDAVWTALEPLLEQDGATLRIRRREKFLEMGRGAGI